jgi:UDP-glucose 4-epimerase
VNSYGASKLAAEAAAAYQARTGKIGSAILRAANIAGAVDGRGDDDLSRIIPKTLAVAAGRFGQLHVNGDGTAVREYLHVADFADACVRAIEACEPGTHQEYNVGIGTGTTVCDIHRCRREDHRPPHRRMVASPQPEPQVLLADSSRIRAGLGWKPGQSGLAEIMSDAWQAMRCLGTVGG